jgi:hypothetical protein
MTKLVLLIVLSATVAPSVRAGDARDSLRDVMDFCNQFVIRDPDPGIRLGYHHDCHINDRDDDRGVPWRY